MQKRFLLTPGYLNNLRCFEYESTVGDKPVRRFKIFDATDDDVQKKDVKHIDDLAKHPGLLLFEAYIDKLGKAYAADRRLSQKTKNTNK
jgi:hypothetical protein